jgi:hypothetical protein
MAKLYDISVTTGTYEVNGEKKYRSERVGSVWEGKNGPYLRINRTFNPAGVPVTDSTADSIICNMFTPRERDGQGGYTPATSAPMASVNATASAPSAVPFDDDIPF